MRNSETVLRTAPTQFRASDSRCSSDTNGLINTVARAKKGDLTAQTELVRAYRRRISGHVRSIIRHTDDAEDVTQVVMEKMLRLLGRLRDVSVFESWLFKLSRNSAVDYIRNRQRRPRCVADATYHEVPAGNDAERLVELQQEVDAVLAELGPVDRTIIRMFIEGHSYHIIAENMGVTPTCIRRRLHQVRPFLRARLRSDGKPGAARAPRRHLG
jgi:RNA polymerase sigma-70 factor (ECF subfamily)